ncbi:putative Ubiquitin-conjugating enzyme E2-34 kDa [Glarea lozoyensis 74030]|uniref:Putative Ubiquitin-conjugating enzyme E2-34 kDa n=1 Tax=Glarea lozoyensis (strain ATCC 74030 / MF5533) TaxID=1104152 RepID=H0EN47_GLAL7|nr:putative Ubiquitin-conjugating enzyme E2-34 kDa [Glarea lozoyensis 74030]
MSTASKQRLMAEYKTLDKEKWLNIELSDGGIFKWVIGIMVINPESAFDGGYFQIASPANVDAGVMYRDNRALYNSKAQDAVKASKKDIPAGFVMPTTLESAPPEKITEDDNFWNESGGEEDDFGASDSSGDDFGMDDDEEEEGEDEEEDEA